MGMSIDSAVTKWEKEKKTFLKPNLIASCFLPDGDDEREIFYRYVDTFRELGGFVYYSKFDNIHFNQGYYDVYSKYTTSFIHWMKNEPESELKDWFLEQMEHVKPESILIHSDYDTFFISNELEEYTQNMWIAKEYASINEDGKLLNMAVSNLNDLYGVSLSSVMISRDELDSYDENDEYSHYLDERISWDNGDLVKIMEFALNTIQPKPHDEFFEDRMERLHLLLGALKQGAKFVYSV